MKQEVQTVLALVVLLWSAPAAGADEGSGHLAPNSVYAEGFGAAIAYSLNYERLIVDQVAVRVGVSLFGVHAGRVESGFVAFPITASYVGLRSHKHALEIGGGVTLANSGFDSVHVLSAYTTGDGLEPIGVAFVGYRLHPEGGAGLQARAGVMVLSGNGIAFAHNGSEWGDAASAKLVTTFGIVPWVYWSLGASI
jgi:hypothetical protein